MWKTAEPGMQCFEALDRFLHGTPVEQGAAYMSLRRLVRNCLGPSRTTQLAHDLDDFIHDRLLDIARKHAEGTLREPTFPGFVRVLVHWRFIDWINTQHRELLAGEEPGAEPPTAALPDHETRHFIQAALAQLPYDQRMVLLARVEGLTLQETSQMLGLSIAKVVGRLDKAQSTLRKLLG
jgi:RNA polymerase sigma factor (sigma-70 family)